MITQENTLFMAGRRIPAVRIHAIPAPKSSIVRFVDAIDSPVALLDRDGRVTTMNGPARDCFIGRSGLQLREAVESFARHVMGDRRKSGDGAPNRAQTIEIGQDRFVATVVAAGPDLATQGVGAMVMLRRERVGGHAPQLGEQALSRRFGLTRQEARVAVMLADQRSNREVADRLGVSVHTARHHTERVLAKLHIHSRHDVKRVIG
jgi:DNA-binding CsgD family transcriptional regulator